MALFGVAEVEEATQMGPEEAPELVAIGRLAQVAHIARPCAVLPEAAPRFGRKVREVANGRLLARRELSFGIRAIEARGKRTYAPSE